MLRLRQYILVIACLLASSFQVLAQFAMPDSVCLGETKHYWVDSTATTGSIYKWSIDGVVKQNNHVDLFHPVWNSLGNYVVSVQELSSEGCLGPLRTGQVYVLPVPTLAAIGSNPVSCFTNGNIQFTFSNTPDGLYTISYDLGQFSNVSVVGGSANVSAAVGNYNNLRISVCGCNSQQNVNVSLLPPASPTLVATGNNPTDCSSNGSIGFTFTQVPDGVYTIQYDGGSFTNVNITSGTAVVYAPVGSYNNLKITVNGCVSIPGVNVILTQPLPTAVLSGGASVCEGDSAILHVVFTGTAPWNLSYTNGISNNSISNIVANPFNLSVLAQAGTLTYTLTALSDAHCTATVAQLSGSAVVVGNPLPVIDFSANSACLGDTTYFSAIGSNISSISHWVWEYGDGTFGTFNTPASPSHVYPTSGAYTVVLHVQDTLGCTYSVNHSIEVRPLPVAFFNTSLPNCDGKAIAFFDLSTNPSGQGYIKQWAWSFGDGSSVVVINFPANPNISHLYPASGDYMVSLTVTTSLGCSSSFISHVTITNRPNADFTYQSNCVSMATQFQDASVNNGTVPVNAWRWDFGDAVSGASNISFAKDPQHVYNTPGTYLVKLVVSNTSGCTDSVTKTIVVKPSPIVDFGSSAGCVNAPTFFWADTTLININSIASYTWSFGDGGTATSRNAQHTYLTSATYTVALTVQDTAGCAANISHIITVTIPPVAHFSANTNNCTSQAMNFTDLSTSLLSLIHI